MSSRQLRKLRQQKELEAQSKLPEPDAEEDSDDEPIAPIKSKASLFANLAALEDENADDEPDEPEEVGEEASKLLTDPAHAPVPVPASAKKAQKSKKKKKKGKNKGKGNLGVESKDDEDIDSALQELALEKPSVSSKLSSTPVYDPEYERVCKLLGISTNHLKVGNEMRNLFGKGVMDNHDDAGGAVPRGGRRQRAAQQQVDLETALKGRHAPGKGLPELTLRRNIFVQGKDDWPRATSGLTIDLVDDQSKEDGTMEYRFVHDKAYQDLQKNFHAFVEMGDPENLITLLTRNPYHISLLLQVSKIAKDQGDHSLSSDLLERALFSFARTANSVFASKLARGKIRMDFARPENRELWLAGYQYIKSLVMKGTYRTALEWAKLMLSIDPEGDPYCMRLMIHHLALRSSEFQWLLDVYDSKIPSIWTPDGLKDSPDGFKESKAAFYSSPSLVLAALQLREGARARKLLTKSMETMPWLFTRLFKELNLDPPSAVWGVQPRSGAEQLFSEIYVMQTKDLWNSPEATSLLMEIAHAIPEVDTMKPPLLCKTEITLDVVRFVYLDNTPALMSLVPGQLLHRGNNSDSDPLPPDFNIYSYEAQRHWIERGPEGARGAFADFMNPLAAIARMIPGFRRDAPAPRDPDDLDLGAMREQVEGLRRDLEALERGDVPGNVVPRSAAQTFLDALGFGSGGHRHDDDDDDEEEEEEENAGGLVFSGEWVDSEDSSTPSDDGEQEPTDDEMPPLSS